MNSTKGRRTGGIPAIPLSEILVENYSYQTVKLKKRLWESGILKEECFKCGLGNIWQGESITLQLDHINGNRYDNRLENLRILCPNCHTQTETYGFKRGTGNKKQYYCKCGKIINRKSKSCRNCRVKKN